MRHFPVFLKVEGKRIVVSGGGETAIAKLRLLLKSQADVHVYTETPEAMVLSWAQAGLLELHCRSIRADDFYNAAFSYAAEDNPDRDARTHALARMAGVLSNIVDNLEESEFITPALVDRDPVIVAIGTEGTAPVLARKIKSEIEETLPGELGLLARIGERFRSSASILPGGSPRRKFWSKFFFEWGPKALRSGGHPAVEQALIDLLDESKEQGPLVGKVFIVGAGPGDPDLLTRKALKVLDEADVVIHDRLVGPLVLELARREAIRIETGKKGFGPSWKQEDINALMIKHALEGARIVRLKSGDASVFGRLDEEMEALDSAGIPFEVVPGITTASAAAAEMNVSLTKRNRNSAFQILTAQDIKGFADHDWRTLARTGSVAAIYMGLKSAHFLAGRLMMHGADGEMPITIVQNVSRPDQKMVVSSIYELVSDAERLEDDGPSILMLGLEPRNCEQVIWRSLMNDSAQLVGIQ